MTLYALIGSHFGQIECNVISKMFPFRLTHNGQLGGKKHHLFLFHAVFSLVKTSVGSSIAHFALLAYRQFGRRFCCVVLEATNEASSSWPQADTRSGIQRLGELSSLSLTTPPHICLLRFVSSALERTRMTSSEAVCEIFFTALSRSHGLFHTSSTTP